MCPCLLVHSARMESEDAVLDLCVGQTLTCLEFQVPRAPEGMEWDPRLCGDARMSEF